MIKLGQRNRCVIPTSQFKDILGPTYDNTHTAVKVGLILLEKKDVFGTKIKLLRSVAKNTVNERDQKKIRISQRLKTDMINGQRKKKKKKIIILYFVRAESFGRHVASLNYRLVLLILFKGVH